MATGEGITTTQELGSVIENWPAKAHDQVLLMIEGRATQFRSFSKQGSETDFVKAFYEVFDETLADQKTLTSCRKGCFFCCRQNVAIYKAEASLIAEYCQEHDISIPRDYLLQQLKHGWKEIAKAEVGWCVFLKEGECSIYPVRPLSCRKYHVVSPPALCDTVKYPADQGNVVSVPVFTMPEIEASAFCAAMAEKGKSGRLPEMLLPYSK